MSVPDTPPFSSNFDSSHARPPDSDPRRRAVAALVAFVAIWAVALLPLRVVGVGFRPTDDVRRHAAKVLANKSWSEIVVLREEATVDPHPGWHVVLSWAHRAGVGSATGLVVFSMLSLGFLVLVTPLALRYVRGEAWLLALLVPALGSAHFCRRLMIGRPFLVSMAVLLALACIWPRLRSDRLSRGTWFALVALFGMSVWIHGNWYLWALPIGCFVLAGELRVAIRVGGAALAGTALGALATGAPLDFLAQTVRHPFWALATDLPTRVLVGEFQPSGGEPLMVVAAAGFLIWRRLRGRALAPLARDPVALLALSGWILGLHTQRFWLDWGMPACVLLMAREIDDALNPVPRGSRRQLLVTLIAAATLFFAVTADRQSRWSASERSAFLSLDNPEHREWLPDPGGILYSNQMRVFYNTFWKNPQAEWRYILGFEPALMPPVDLATFRKVQLEFSSDASFRPWVEKMRPADRLIVVRGGAPPRIAALEWHSPYRGMWIGRLPGSGVAAPPSRAEGSEDGPDATEGDSPLATEGTEPQEDRSAP